MAGCIFCEIVAGQKRGHIVFDDALSLGFLDHRPLFPGHVLLVPKRHCETLPELPGPDVAPFFRNVQRIVRAVEQAMGAQGSFVAVNNRVSQSVPHLHVHVVPRRKGDGLRGFFWPRNPYDGPEHARAVREAIRAALAESAPPEAGS